MDVLWALLFLLFGLIAVWLAMKSKLELGEVAKTALLLAPLVFYLIISGKLVEAEGLGWKAKFRQITTQSAIKAARTSDLAISSKEANQPDFFSEAFWALCRPYYVLKEKTAISPSGKVDPETSLRIAIAIRNSIVCGRFLALVVVDNERRPVGFFLRDQFIDLMRIPLVVYGASPRDPAALFAQIESTELGVILGNPITRAKSNDAYQLTIRSEADLGTAYKALLAAKIDIAPLVDRLGQFDGIIARAAIEGRIIEGLIDSTN